MKKEQLLLFANPIAGKGKARRIAAVLEKGLKAGGYGVRIFSGQIESTETKIDGRIKAAMVIGGDGTLRGVAQWAIDSAFPSQEAMCATGELANLPYPLLIVPMGTANLMGKHLGVHWSDENIAEEVAAALEAGKVAHLDVAGTDGGIFLVRGGGGFDAAVVHEV